MSDPLLPLFEVFLDSLQLKIIGTKPFINPNDDGSRSSTQSSILSIVDLIELSVAEHVYALDARTQALESQQNLQTLAKCSTRWLVQALDALSEAGDEADVEKVARVLSLLSGRGSSGPVKRHFKFGKVELVIREPSYVEAEIGWQTWGAAVLAAKLIDIGALTFHDRAVIELGCGTALAGLMAHLAGGASRTVLTDYQDAVLRNVSQNIALNITGDSVIAQKLDWRDIKAGQQVEETFDTVLAADCIFEMEHGELVPLVADLCLRAAPRTLEDGTVLRPEFHAVLPLREKYVAEISNFERAMDEKVNEGRFVLESREDMDMEEDLTGLRYRKYVYFRP